MKGATYTRMRKLSDYEPVLASLMRLLARDTAFEAQPGLPDIFAAHPRLIVAMSHGSPLSWIPSVSLLALSSCAAGAGHRRPMGVADNFFFQVPILKDLVAYFTQTSRPLSYAELSERFAEVGDIDLVLFPEGSNCFFGPPDEIQEFRSPKFVELSVRTGAPVLICVHSGSEKWAKAIPVPEEVMEHLPHLPRFAYEFLQKRLKKTGLLSLPLLPTPMDRFEMRCELFTPALAKSELSDDMDERRGQLLIESEKIRSRMRQILVEMRANPVLHVSKNVNIF